MNQKENEHGTFRGKPLEECTREELYECIESLHAMYEDECKMHGQTLEFWSKLRQKCK
jgi:hypothetical protein